ncbi:hypothetical protein FF38_07674 [Lucilia cuprina]|uniref:Uncharacterized protein n=1 Tax=Lucilia cuprina TaxID=7375 RepID=A0A0L0BNK3_LUCCU|nr:hypothetical protein FF38_07674 [Lucilia cuprina]
MDTIDPSAINSIHYATESNSKSEMVITNSLEATNALMAKMNISPMLDDSNKVSRHHSLAEDRNGFQNYKELMDTIDPSAINSIHCINSNFFNATKSNPKSEMVITNTLEATNALTAKINISPMLDDSNNVPRYLKSELNRWILLFPVPLIVSTASIANSFMRRYQIQRAR